MMNKAVLFAAVMMIAGGGEMQAHALHRRRRFVPRELTRQMSLGGRKYVRTVALL